MFSTKHLQMSLDATMAFFDKFCPKINVSIFDSDSHNVVSILQILEKVVFHTLLEFQIFKIGSKLWPAISKLEFLDKVYQK